MVNAHLNRSLPSAFHRLVAAWSALMVFALGLLAVSPSAHACIHDDHSVTSEQGCAVELFAQGVTLARPPPMALPQMNVVAPTNQIVAELFLIATRYLHKPERGPPSRVK